MRNNRDDNKREIYKKADNKRKKEKHDNINTHEKELLNNYEKKEREKCSITLMMTKGRR